MVRDNPAPLNNYIYMILKDVNLCIVYCGIIVPKKYHMTENAVFKYHHDYDISTRYIYIYIYFSSSINIDVKID